MADTRTMVTLGLGALVCGTVYVLMHERKRKRKKIARLAEDQPITKEMLLRILNKSAEHSKSIIERIHVEIRKIKEARKLSDQQAMVLFQQNFEHALDQLIGAIRKQYNVTEKAMDAAFKQHQEDPQVMAAIQSMRVLSSQQSATLASDGGAASSSGAGVIELPASLTRDRLREIMTFNAAMLERELKPIKEEMSRQKRAGKQPQVDTQALMQLQARISEMVQAKYGVTDEQVMAAVEHFGAKNDESFKPILTRIATTLNASLG